MQDIVNVKKNCYYFIDFNANITFWLLPIFAEDEDFSILLDALEGKEEAKPLWWPIATDLFVGCFLHH